MTLKHLLVNILGGGGKQTRKTNQPKKKRNSWGNNISVYMYTHMHVHADRCMGVCAFWECFLQCTTCFDKRNSFQEHLHGSIKTFKETNSKLSKQIKKSLSEKKKRSVKHHLCVITMHFPWATLKPKQLKMPTRAFFHLKGPSKARGAVLGFAFGPHVCRAGENAYFYLPEGRDANSKGKKLHLWGKIKQKKTCSMYPFLTSLISKDSRRPVSSLRGWIFQRVHLCTRDSEEDVGSESPRYFLQRLSPCCYQFRGLRYSSNIVRCYFFKSRVAGLIWMGGEKKNLHSIYIFILKSNNKGYKSIILRAAQGLCFLTTSNSHWTPKPMKVYWRRKLEFEPNWNQPPKLELVRKNTSSAATSKPHTPVFVLLKVISIMSAS